MITGTYSNQFGINGTVFSQQPTEHHWADRESLGIDGNGNSVYVSPRQYEMKWDLVDTEVFTEMYAYFTAQGVTGTVTATLPKWNATPYQMYNYSGCIIREFTYDNWFENYYSNVKLTITRIDNT